MVGSQPAQNFYLSPAISSILATVAAEFESAPSITPPTISTAHSCSGLLGTSALNHRVEACVQTDVLVSLALTLFIYGGR